MYRRAGAQRAGGHSPLIVAIPAENVNCYRRVTIFSWFFDKINLPFSEKEDSAVLELIEMAIYRYVGGFFAFFLLLPAALIFLGYLIYIVVMTVRELRKK